MASYEQNKSSKLWSCRFRLSDGGREINKRLSGFKTKREAKDAYEVFKREYDEAQKLKSAAAVERILFTTLVTACLENKKLRTKYSSYYTLLSRVNKHIVPFFEGKYIDEIKPIDILEWQKTVDHYTYAYKSGLMRCISAVYKYGERYHDIPNIMHKVEPFRNMEYNKETLFWTKDEFLQFISECSDIMYNTLFRLLYITGCRKGEALALSWSDIDFDNKSITINKSITRRAVNKAWEVTTPKNASSNRKVEIPLSLCEVLRSYKAWQEAHDESTSFIFGGERPLHENTLDRYFTSAVKKAGVKKIRIHDLRHSCASLLVSEGISIVAISKRLGHKNIEQTLNTYSHLMPTESQRMTAVFENI